MSYALVVYSVPLDELLKVVGSKNTAILKEIEKEDADYLDETDDLYDPEDFDEPLLSIRDAILRIINGEPLKDAPQESVATYAFEAICRHLGSHLDNGIFQPPIRQQWLQTVDDYLEGIGFPLRVQDLAFGDCPIDIPRNAIPGTGCWMPDRLPEAMEILSEATPEGESKELSRARADILGWLEEAIEQGNDCIVGFYC